MSGVFQQIQHHLSDQVLVGIDQQIARGNAKPDGSIFLSRVRFGQFRHALKKRLYIERREPGSRNAGHLAIGFHEADQAPAGRIDCLQSLADLPLHFVFHSQQRIAERRDRSDRIHDLVRQHADQANP